MSNLYRLALAVATISGALLLPIAANAQGAEYPVAASYALGPTLSLPAVVAAPCCRPDHGLSAIWDWSIVSNSAVVPSRLPADDVGLVRTIVGPQLSNIPVF